MLTFMKCRWEADVILLSAIIDTPLQRIHLPCRLPNYLHSDYITFATAMHLILTGATGLVGAAVLDSMLAQEAVTRISILSRRPVKMADGHAKAKVIIQTDFKTYDAALLDELKDARGCVWALGASQNDVDKACGFSHSAVTD